MKRLEEARKSIKLQPQNNCPFSLTINYRARLSSWIIIIREKQHNHDRIEDPLSSSALRQASQVGFSLECLEKLVETRDPIVQDQQQRASPFHRKRDIDDQ